MWWKYQIYPSVVNYRAIQSFDHPCTLNMFMSMESCHTQTHIHINYQLTNNDSNEEVLETLSNLLLAFGQKTFLSHLGLRIHRMRSPLTRSDRFHIDLLTIFIHTPPYLEHPILILMPCLDRNQNMGSCAQDSMMVSGLRITCTTLT